MNALDHQDDPQPAVPCYASISDVLQVAFAVWIACGLLGYFVGI